MLADKVGNMVYTHTPILRTTINKNSDTDTWRRATVQKKKRRPSCRMHRETYRGLRVIIFERNAVNDSKHNHTREEPRFLAVINA